MCLVSKSIRQRSNGCDFAHDLRKIVAGGGQIELRLILAMPKIAISYRRSDSSAIAGRIFDRLVAHYGRESVFMDIEDIPFGVDFRKHIQATLQSADILLVLVGPQWIGSERTGSIRIRETADPVRVEVEIALNRGMPVLPILIDSAKMPLSTDLPESLHDFAFLNAADVAIGRDFHTHMVRLIGAIDRTALPSNSDAPTPYATPVNAWVPGWLAAPTDAPGASLRPASWSACLLRYLGFPVVVLLVAHHLIVNSFDLDSSYLRGVSFVVPFCFGFFLFWHGRSSLRAAIALGVATGFVAVTGMTISQSLSAGDPILPTTIYEWRENIEYFATISLSFTVAHMLARTLYSRLADKRIPKPTGESRPPET
jgi:hypothetical protein